MNGKLEYKGYWAKVEFDSESMVIHGRVEGIRDLVTFESTDAKAIEQEFRNAVDDYLELCEQVGKKPDKAYKGSFNVRIDPDLHKQLAMKATVNGINLNTAVEHAIREYVSPAPKNAEVMKQAFKEFLVEAQQKNASNYLFSLQKQSANNSVIDIREYRQNSSKKEGVK